MKESTLDRVREIAAGVFDVPAASLDAASSPATVESWDSVQHLSLVLELEQSFGVHFEPEEMESMKDLGAIAQQLEAKTRSGVTGA